MPLAPPQCCPCGGKRINGVCDRCGPRKRQAHTKTTTERGYDWAWQKFRARYLAEHPLCQDCLPERVTAAEEVHHRQKIRDRPDLRLDEANVVGLCGNCHDRRTARGE